jgi:nucleoside-diphosphate-sugar epimerase
MNSLSGKKVFITGATGFVGSNLVRRALSRGADVYINTRSSSDTWRIRDILSDVTVIPADITVFKRLQDSLREVRPEIIFHAAVYGGNAQQSDIQKIIDTNICGTVNLLKCCRTLKLDLFVNTGSSSEYGLKNHPMNESDLLDPVTDYGTAKAAATLFCRSHAKSEKIPVVTLRLFSPYGPYEQKSRLVPSVILAALQKNNPIIASRQFVRDFIFIDDVLDAYEAVMLLKNPAGEVFNIGSGQQQTVGEVTDMIINLLGNEVTAQTGSPQAWKNEPASWQADIRRAKSALHWEPRYSIRKGLATTVDWFKMNKTLYLEVQDIS